MAEVDDGSPLASWRNSSIVGGDKMASLDDIPYSGDELLSVEQFLYNDSSEQEGSPSFEALSVNQSRISQDEDTLVQERGIIDVNMTEPEQTNSSLGLMTLMVMEEADDKEQEEEHDHAHGGRQLMMEIGILTSLIMLVLALFILLVLPNGRKSYFNVVKLQYLVSVTFKYILLCILYFGGLPLYHAHPLCMLVGYLAHYFFIASFFWLGTMSFTVWNTFRHLKATKREDKSERQRKVLLACGYSWGSPVILSCTTAVLQYADPSSIPVPDIGVFSCFLFDHSAKIVYDHVPTLLLLLGNLYFFASTAWVLFYGFWAEKRANSVNQRRRPHKQRLLIVTFLFFISGTPWLLDVLNGFIAHNNHHLFFFIFDLINAFNGLFIFLLFIAKKEVMMGLRQLLRRGRDQNGVRAMFSATSHVALTLSSSISTNVSSPAVSIEQ